MSNADPTTEPVVTYAVRDGVAYVTLNRPAYANAQNSKVTYALDRAFTDAVDDDEVKVIVLGGKGRHFCGGHDIGTPGRDIDESFERKAVIWWDHIGAQASTRASPASPRSTSACAAAGARSPSRSSRRCSACVAGG